MVETPTFLGRRVPWWWSDEYGAPYRRGGAVEVVALRRVCDELWRWQPPLLALHRARHIRRAFNVGPGLRRDATIKGKNLDKL